MVLPRSFQLLSDSINGRVTFGAVGVRDPEFPCDAFDGEGYTGLGDCLSDGHYLCVDCSRLSANAPRFTQDRAGRGDRLRAFWGRRKARLGALA